MNSTVGPMVYLLVALVLGRLMSLWLSDRPESARKEVTPMGKHSKTRFGSAFLVDTMWAIGANTLPA